MVVSGGQCLSRVTHDESCTTAIGAVSVRWHDWQGHSGCRDKHGSSTIVYFRLHSGCREGDARLLGTFIFTRSRSSAVDGGSCTLAAGKAESESEDSDDDDFDEKPAPKKRAPAARPSSAGDTGKAKAGPQLKKSKGQVGWQRLAATDWAVCWPEE